MRANNVDVKPDVIASGRVLLLEFLLRKSLDVVDGKGKSTSLKTIEDAIEFVEEKLML